MPDGHAHKHEYLGRRLVPVELAVAAAPLCKVSDQAHRLRRDVIVGLDPDLCAWAMHANISGTSCVA